MFRYNAVKLTFAPTLHANDPNGDKKIKSVTEELRVQLALEDRWENLVRTLAVEAGDQSSIFVLLRLVIEQAGVRVAEQHANCRNRSRRRCRRSSSRASRP